MSRIPEKINALISKAQSTEHEAERDTYLAKAQQLMEDYAVSQAELDLAKPSEQRVPIEILVEHKRSSVGGPAKGSMMIRIASANRCQIQGIHKDGKYFLRIQGMPEDAEFVEQVYTSLCLQLEQQYDTAIKAGKKPAWDNGRSYRASFYEGFMTRVGQRIQEDARNRQQENTGTSRELVLTNSKKRVEEHFGKVRYGTRRASNRSAVGRAHGSDAGSSADVSGGKTRGIGSRKQLR